VRAYVKPEPNWTGAIEGCAEIGKHIANLRPADGEYVLDVSPKLSTRTPMLAVV
jgi:hypothetical protein